MIQLDRERVMLDRERILANQKGDTFLEILTPLIPTLMQYLTKIPGMAIGDVSGFLGKQDISAMYGKKPERKPGPAPVHVLHPDANRVTPVEPPEPPTGRAD
jgi:hypothetical protein